MQPVDIGPLRTAYTRVRVWLQGLVRPRPSSIEAEADALPSQTPPVGTRARDAAVEVLRRTRDVRGESVEGHADDAQE